MERPRTSLHSMTEKEKSEELGWERWEETSEVAVNRNWSLEKNH